MEIKSNTRLLADDFIGVYPVSKSLRFELIPQGRTLEYIERDGILESDCHRADSYRKVKELIDRYHKAFIDEALCGLQLENLADYVELYGVAGRDEKEEKQFQDIQASLRAQISKRFKSHPKYKDLFKKELIKKDLLVFLKGNPEERALVEEFADFTTYFVGFYSNRENMYSGEAKSTAIAYRIVHQNLPKYVDNMKAYVRLRESDAFTLVKRNLPALQDKFGLESIEPFFTLNGFTEVLSQKGIDIYNGILGGYVADDNSKIQGLNESINLYNQQQRSVESRLPKLKVLYKQILSDRESKSFVLEQFENGTEVLKAVKVYYEELCREVIECEEEISLPDLIDKMNHYDPAKIYIANDASITDISQYIFGDWFVLRKAISDCYDRQYLDAKAEKNREKYEEKKKKKLKGRKLYSVKELNDMAEQYTGDPCSVEKYFILQISEKIAKMEQEYEICRGLLEEENNAGELYRDKDAVQKLKNLLDAVKEVQFLVKPLLKGQEEAEKDELFYGELIRIWDKLDRVNALYNKVRNYATKKPYSLEKVKLNFNRSTLLDGWDRNKEKDNLGIILMKDNCYYLGIMNRKSNRVMEDAPIAGTQNAKAF